MIAFTARQLLQMPRGEIWNIPFQHSYDVTFDDGTVSKLRKQHLLFNRYCWELLAMYPDVPITPACDVTTFIKATGYDGDTHRLLLEAIFKYICKQKNLLAYRDKSPMLKMVYQIVDMIQNEILLGASAWVTTISSSDFVRLIKDPQIEKIHKNLRSTPDGMDRAYREIREFVNTSEEFNRFTQAYRSKAVNDNQANQCIGPRGFVTDLNRTVFTAPITSGFIRGMSNLYELMTESCTAGKSLNANGVHIQTSEYASRRFQILAMVVEGIYYGDCGSTQFVDMTFRQGTSDLDNARGKYYLQDDGSLGCIEGDETYLYNKLVKVRNSLFCKHPDSSKICTTCLGALSMNFKENSNLGYTMAAFLMEKISQGILGTKHLTHSVRKAMVQLFGLASSWFYSDENSNLYFRPEVNLANIQMVLPNASVGRLVDVLNLEHTNIGLAKIGELDSVSVRDMSKKTPTLERLTISYKDRNCVMTHHFLKHIKSVAMESDHRGNFVIPMDTYNKALPIFTNPLKETNILTFVSKVASLVETNKDKITDPVEKLGALMNVVSERFKCNLSVLEVLIYAGTAYNDAGQDYSLARNSPNPRTAGRTEIFRYRDFGGLAVFEKQPRELFEHPAIAFGKGIRRQEHPMNVFFTPQAVAKT